MTSPFAEPLLRTAEPALEPGDRALHAAIDVLRERAFHEVTLREVAERADVPVAVLAARFGDPVGLAVAAVQVWNAERIEPLLPVARRFGAIAFLRGVVQANVADPALMRVLTALVNVAATPDHPLAGELQRQWIRFYALVQRTLVHDVETGREPATMEPPRGAEQLLAVYEGLQLQSMVRPNMDLLGAYDRAVTRLRDGWTREYAPPIWNI